MRNRPENIKELSDDALIFWMLFTRDGLVAMRNADEHRLKDEIASEEKALEELLVEIKRRMKGGK